MSRTTCLLSAAFLLASVLPAQAGPSAVSPNRRYRAVARGGTVSITPERSTRPVTQLVHRSGTVVTALAWSPDSRFLATGNGSGRVWMWRPDLTGRNTSVLGQVRWITGPHAGSVLRLIFDPHGRTVMARVSRGGPLYLFAARDGRVIPLRSIPRPPTLP